MIILIAFVCVSTILNSDAAFLQNRPVIGPNPRLATINSSQDYLGGHGDIMTNSSLSRDGWYRSHIATISCFNLGGIVRANGEKNNGPNEFEETISLPLGSCPNFVAVTGESGSGKSLLISKSLNLILGGKVTASLLPRPPCAKIEVILKLSEPHITMAHDKLSQEGIDTSSLVKNDIDQLVTLTFQREFLIQERGLKSTCKINGKVVPLRKMSSIASTFIAVVDSTTASIALSSPIKRLKMIDIAVSYQHPDILRNVVSTRNMYRESRIRREKIEKEIESRVLPKALKTKDPLQQEAQIDLMRHFVDELDDFESRVHSFRDKVNHVFHSFAASGEKDKNAKTKKKIVSIDSFYHYLSTLASSNWFDVKSEEDSPVSIFYTSLIDVKEALKKLDTKIIAAESARDTISSLSAKQSMISALESARKFLYEADLQSTTDDDVSRSFEKSHELLNDLEDVLIQCKRFFDDDLQSPLAKLSRLKSSVGVTIEDIDLLLTDWSVLARKHGVSPYLLPSCHQSLRLELDGSVENSNLLPEAKQREALHFVQFEEACALLSDARRKVCRNLSKAVSQQLPSLGMDGFLFISRINPNSRSCSDAIVGSLGVDSIDFLLLNKKMLKHDELTSIWDADDQYNQLLDIVGSSGEKARVLLCIETSIPGSVGACTVDLNSTRDYAAHDLVHPMVAILYDEIDAHVGGRALISLGKMLLEQTEEFEAISKDRKRRGQVISITHSASLAALANHHLVVHKIRNSTFFHNVIEVSVDHVEGEARFKELARMASGDIAIDEAEIFAKALIRDSLKAEEEHES